MEEIDFNIGHKMEQRVLIVSNNVLSLTKNNGKTVYSLFDSIPQGNLAQIYFSSETPEIDGINYYRISDKDVIDKRLLRKKSCGGEIGVSQNSIVDKELKRKVPRNAITCSIRDILWLKVWKNDDLKRWLDLINPSVVFFVAGDTFFSYDVALFIQHYCNARLCMYVTDDYVISYPQDGFFARIRKFANKRIIKKTLQSSDAFFTVSPMMSAEYERIFNRRSNIFVNIPDNISSCKNTNSDDNRTIVYAGSLYYGRLDIIKQFAILLQDYNLSVTNGYKLLVYTGSDISSKDRDFFISTGCVELHKAVDSDTLKNIMINSELLLFVESFDQKYINKTRLSLSTKIPEYLSYGKPILALGPDTVSSIQYLKDVSYCVDICDKTNSLSNILNDRLFQKELSLKALKKYYSYHEKNKIQKRLLSFVLGEDIKDRE